MLKEFALLYAKATGKPFDYVKRRIKYVTPSLLQPYRLTVSSRLCSCLGHVVNLSTQACITTYSKTPHFDPEHPHEHLRIAGDGLNGRDEIGLIRAICVKVCAL